MRYLYPAELRSAEYDACTSELTRAVIEQQDTLVLEAYSALLDANTPPDIRKVAWAGRMGELKLSPCGTKMVGTYQGYFVDRHEQED